MPPALRPSKALACCSQHRTVRKAACATCPPHANHPCALDAYTGNTSLQVSDSSEGDTAALLRKHERVAPCIFVAAGTELLPLKWQAPRQSADALALRWQEDIEGQLQQR